jgi:hypothetical protein
MPSPSHLARIPQLVEALVEGANEQERDRVLLSAVFELEAGVAAAVWKPIRKRKGDRSPRWRPVLEHGPADLLPPPAEVEASLTGGVGFDLPHGRLVLHAGGGGAGREIALALGGVSEVKEGAQDTLEALLGLWCLLATPPDGAPEPDALDLLHSLLPDPSLLADELLGGLLGGPLEEGDLPRSPEEGPNEGPKEGTDAGDRQD